MVLHSYLELYGFLCTCNLIVSFLQLENSLNMPQCYCLEHLPFDFSACLKV
ncbi:hypothetical protein OIU77_016402 [Salix suchowensis]|uniref:Uncharacterized protein n=1 Tax=Salix suchowensis TaxID=1278906 RepID=A0ABQ8ZKC1_9ROSI|nr:hypothetical protein OIU77_016402 [Salix suchowensis]